MASVLTLSGDCPPQVETRGVKPYKRFQSQGHAKQKWPTVAASLTITACLVVEIIQR